MIPGGLQGVGGAARFVVVSATLEFEGDDGGRAGIDSEFAAFPEPGALELSILGRDNLGNFDAIISYRRGEVLLLTADHGYGVSQD